HSIHSLLFLLSSLLLYSLFCFFFFNVSATTEIYTLSLHDALPIYPLGNWKATTTYQRNDLALFNFATWRALRTSLNVTPGTSARSEEHTSELQSRRDLVCRLLLEKKNKIF